MGFGYVLANPSLIKTDYGSLTLDQTKARITKLNSDTNTGNKTRTGGVKRSIRRKRKVARTKKRTVTLSEKRK